MFAPSSDTKDGRSPIKQEYSAGGCVYKKYQISNTKSQILWLIGKHSGYHKWVLPKGMIEKGERAIETAVRETEEEMGVKGHVVNPKPIHEEKYWFVAEYGDDRKDQRVDDKLNKRELGTKNGGEVRPLRRVEVYQENPNFEKKGSRKFKVFKTVSFYLMEFVGGDPKNHDWEMEEAGWYEFEDAIELLAFDGEKQALRLAKEAVGKRL